MTQSIQRDNSDPLAKVLLRRWLIKELGGIKNTKVLELYGGLGHLYDHVPYTDAKEHMAFELRKVNRPTWLQGDNRILLKDHALGWDLYDIDSYTVPWQLANDICRMREDGRFGFALTCGMYRSFNTGKLTPFLRQRIGLNGIAYGETGLITRWYFDAVRWLMLDWQRWGVTVERGKYIFSEATHRMHYFGVILNKDASTAKEWK